MEGSRGSSRSRRRYEAAQKAAGVGSGRSRAGGRIEHAPGPLHGWTAFRDLPALPAQAFRDWWRTRAS